MTILQRQFITDAQGKYIGIILPIEEYTLVEAVLAQRLQEQDIETKLAQLAEAPNDPAFMDDLNETMQAFAHADREGWEN